MLSSKIPRDISQKHVKTETTGNKRNLERVSTSYSEGWWIELRIDYDQRSIKNETQVVSLMIKV